MSADPAPCNVDLLYFTYTDVYLGYRAIVYPKCNITSACASHVRYLSRDWTAVASSSSEYHKPANDCLQSLIGIVNVYFNVKSWLLCRCFLCLSIRSLKAFERYFSLKIIDCIS